MRVHNRLVYVLAVLIITPLVETALSGATLTVLRRLDFPDHPVATAATLPQKISDEGDLIGTVIDITGTQRAFIYKVRLDKFSAAFQDPNDTGNDTQGRGINILRHSCGEYLSGSDGTFHGYVLQHPDFLPFDVTGALDTIPLGINNDGDIVGTTILSDGTQPAFVSIQQTVTTFAVPGATATFAYQLNASNQIIGYYIDANGIKHGYTRDSAGNLAFPIDIPGSTGTVLFGNNNSNWGVGRYTDTAGVTHGLYFITPDDILTFDIPGATFTSLNGINKNGQVCGYYVDTFGFTHGLVLQMSADGTPTPTPTTTPMPTPSPTSTSTPRAQLLPERLKMAMPAL